MKQTIVAHKHIKLLSNRWIYSIATLTNLFKWELQLIFHRINEWTWACFRFLVLRLYTCLPLNGICIISFTISSKSREVARWRTYHSNNALTISWIKKNVSETERNRRELSAWSGLRSQWRNHFFFFSPNM